MSTVVSFAQNGLWSIEKAKKWEKEHPWYCGVNYIPSNAINYTAMRDKTSFSPELIDKEMRLMEELGMNCVRVVLQLFYSMLFMRMIQIISFKHLIIF